MDAGHAPSQSDPHRADPRLASVLGAASLVRNIWTDHQIRRAMFPPRQQTLQGEDEDDIYQMFLPSDPPAPNRERAPPARPCSWHMEQPGGEEEEEEAVPPAGRRVLRRASSVGEKRSESCAPPEGPHTETSSNVSGSDSAERLTPDEVENVYDNISYEDLKAMGLIRDARAPPQTGEGEPGPSAETVEMPAQITVPSENHASVAFSTSSCAPEAPTPAKCELEIVEENIYDTIGLLDLPPLGAPASGAGLEERRLDIPTVSEPVYANCDVAVTSVSEKAEVRDPKASSNADSLPGERGGAARSRMSERVDEIWNDLENYIRKNERKQDTRLLAAFPVGGPEGGANASQSTPTPAPPKTPTPSIPTLLREETMEEEEESQPALPIPRPLPPPPVITETVVGTVRAAKSKLARLSGGSFRFDDGDDGEAQKEGEEGDEEGGSGTLLGLSGSMFPGDLASLDHTVASTGARFQLPGSAGELSLDWGDKTRNRVFLMARQYSQKIKKANQLLKMRGPEQEQAGGRSRPKQKDLAAILEEKKQGGAAIGKRPLLVAMVLDY